MKDKSRFFRMVVLRLACCAVLMFFSAPAFAAADTYPSKPLTFIVPWGPGGSMDTVARLITPGMSERLGVPVVVDNRAGGGGLLGLEAMTKAKPDGHTISIIGDSYAIRPALGGKMPFDPMKGFTPIAILARGTPVLVINPSVPAKNLKEFIALLKQKPGQMICAVTESASNMHMDAELFKKKTGTDFKIIHYKSANEAEINVLGGHSQFGFFSLLTAKAQADSGKLKILGGGAIKQSKLMPNLPSIAEAGVPGFDVPNWWGVVAPAGTPQPVVEKLRQVIKDTLETPEVDKKFLTLGADADYQGPKEMNAALVADIAKWTQVGKEANIKLQD